MLEIPENILDIFFEITRNYVKSDVVFTGESAKIFPCKEEEYYKPVIVIKNLHEFEEALRHHLEVISTFYKGSKNIKPHHDVEYFMTNLYFNMTSSDALDFARYIERRTSFFEDSHFLEYSEPKVISSFNDIEFSVERKTEAPGFESPFILEFSVEIKGKKYPLPLVRYAIDSDNRCHLFAIQNGRKRIKKIKNDELKSMLNKINSGISKFRNVTPSFVVVFRMFLKMLESIGVDTILVPDFLFARYKHYFGGQTETKSDQILERILDNFLLLIQRMEYQFPFFNVEAYPNTVDSFTHIKISSIEESKHLK